MVGLTYITTRSRARVESTTSSTLNTLAVRRVTLMRLSRSSASTCPVTDSAKKSSTAAVVLNEFGVTFDRHDPVAWETIREVHLGRAKPHLRSEERRVGKEGRSR